jgi:L-ascorbate metabolism protein UlaG (beta-lactamase superfamily)
MQITYYGHSCFKLEINDKSVLLDPFISPNSLAANINVEKLSPDYILVSHGHQDHIADVETIYKNSQPLLISTFEVVSYFEKKGLKNTHPMNHGGSKKLEWGRVKMVNAVHTSSFPDGSYAGNPAGFVFETKQGSYYFAGDTALTYDMKLIAEEFDIKAAFLPIGDNFTMGIEDALKAADFVGTNTIVGMHYDTFPYIEIDHENARQLAKEAGKTLNLLAIGETITL